jgi:hypothetical protein
VLFNFGLIEMDIVPFASDRQPWRNEIMIGDPKIVVAVDAGITVALKGEQRG